MNGQPGIDEHSPTPPPTPAQPDVTRGPQGSSAEAPGLDALLEAVLLVADEPISAVILAQVTEHPTAAVEVALSRLAHSYEQQGRGFELRRIAGGWRFSTRADCAPWVERFVRDGQQARLTQAALETLAVVAYRQPVTRARVSAIRGVNVDGVMRTLIARGLLAETGADPETGGTLLATTPLLLQKLGINSLDELPSLAPLLPELDEFEHDSMST